MVDNALSDSSILSLFPSPSLAGWLKVQVKVTGMHARGALGAGRRVQLGGGGVLSLPGVTFALVA